AIPNDGHGVARATSGDPRAAAPPAQASSGAGPLRGRAEDPPRRLDGSALPGEPGQQPEAGGERRPGDRPEGAGGPFRFRVAADRGSADVNRGGNGVPAPSYAARIAASR